MRFQLAIVATVLVLTGTVSAQTTTSSRNARLEGTVNCRFINVSVTQQTANGGTTTNLSYVVRECPSGGTTPTTTIVQGFVAIATSAYRVQGQSHALNVSTEHGLISLTWTPTTQQQTTFSGTWVARENGSSTRTQQDQFFSTARVEGSVAGYPLLAGERPGFISEQTQVVR